jgi:putative oxidoreductase
MSTMTHAAPKSQLFSFPLDGIRALARTEADGVQTMLRVVLAAVMFPHGAQKLFGWFGGFGFEGTMGYLTSAVGLPWVVALLVVLIESLGAVALAAGFMGRAAALGIAAVMVGAAVTQHFEFGFFMNWTGAQGGEGFEFHLLALVLAAAVVVRGSGALSLDRLLTSHR